MRTHELITLRAACSVITELAGLTPPEAAFGELFISKGWINSHVFVLLSLNAYFQSADE